MRKLITLCCLILSGFPALISNAQTYSSKKIPANYFRNPLGIPMEIVANMGELRPNHWHMGLDIRTQQKENQRVYAAAEGYIAHVGVRSQSFGRYIMINHPNGLSTLYAHLNDFFPELEKYVTDQQYKNESWTIELDLTPGMFPVSKGSFIAFSGNTGGSQGPHLHFEIFDTRSGERLNPLLFNFPLKDNVAPSFVKLAVYDRGMSVYEQIPKLFSLKRTDTGYIIPKIPVLMTGARRVSFAIQAYDRINGSNNQDGIFSASIFFNNKLHTGFVIDSIDYRETAYMNAHIDYRHRYNGGAYLQHLSKLPGDKGGVYRGVDGILELFDTIPQDVRIEIKDAYGNQSRLHFRVQYNDSLGNGTKTTLPLFIPNEVNVFEKPEFEIYLPEGALFDTVGYVYYSDEGNSQNGVSARHKFADPAKPVDGSFIIRIKANKPISPENHEKLVMKRTGKRNQSVRAEFKNDWVIAKFDEFGSFQVFTDNVPPSINELGNGDTINLSAASRIVFTPFDNFGIRNFRAELNGQWLRFTNDKGRNWIYKFDERCPYGTHHLKVTVVDLVGNETTKSWWFKRGPYTPPKKKYYKKRPVKKKTSSRKKKR